MASYSRSNTRQFGPVLPDDLAVLTFSSDELPIITKFEPLDLQSLSAVVIQGDSNLAILVQDDGGQDDFVETSLLTSDEIIRVAPDASFLANAYSSSSSAASRYNGAALDLVASSDSDGLGTANSGGGVYFNSVAGSGAAATAIQPIATDNSLNVGIFSPSALTSLGAPPKMEGVDTGPNDSDAARLLADTPHNYVIADTLIAGLASGGNPPSSRRSCLTKRRRSIIDSILLSISTVIQPLLPSSKRLARGGSRLSPVIFPTARSTAPLSMIS